MTIAARQNFDLVRMMLFVNFSLMVEFLLSNIKRQIFVNNIFLPAEIGGHIHCH